MYCEQCGEELTDGADYCGSCGIDLDTTLNRSDDKETSDDVSHTVEHNNSSKKWNPKYPITSVFVATLILWASLVSGRVSDMLLLGIPAILIIPRVRRYVVVIVNERFGVNLASRISKVVTFILYTLLTIVSVMLMIGGAVNDPQMSAWAGFLSILIAYVIAIIIVSVIRVSRKLRN